MNNPRRIFIKKVWIPPTLLVLGTLKLKSAPGGSSIGVGNNENNPACSGKNPPWFCSQ